jgi:ABC-type multidrug transport system fused ATPase/permease subunit
MISSSEVTESFKEYFKERTNGFFATLAAVWVVYNWKVVYAFLYFDKATNLDGRIRYFQSYWEEQHSFLRNLGTVIIYAFVVFTISYLLKYLSKLIANFFIKVIAPLVERVTDKSSIIEKSKYQQLQTRVNELEEKLRKQRSSELKAIQEKEEAERHFESQKQNISDSARHETVRIISTINKHGRDNVFNILDKLDEQIDYQIDDLIESMSRAGAVVIKRNGALGQLKITSYGEKLKQIAYELKT